MMNAAALMFAPAAVNVADAPANPALPPVEGTVASFANLMEDQLRSSNPATDTLVGETTPEWSEAETDPDLALSHQALFRRASTLVPEMALGAEMEVDESEGVDLALTEEDPAMAAVSAEAGGEFIAGCWVWPVPLQDLTVGAETGDAETVAGWVASETAESPKEAMVPAGADPVPGSPAPASSEGQFELPPGFVAVSEREFAEPPPSPPRSSGPYQPDVRAQAAAVASHPSRFEREASGQVQSQASPTGTSAAVDPTVWAQVVTVVQPVVVAGPQNVGSGAPGAGWETPVTVSARVGGESVEATRVPVGDGATPGKTLPGATDLRGETPEKMAGSPGEASSRGGTAGLPADSSGSRAFMGFQGSQSGSSDANARRGFNGSERKDGEATVFEGRFSAVSPAGISTARELNRMNTASYPVETAAPTGHTVPTAASALPSRSAGLEAPELGTFWLANGAPAPVVAAVRPVELPAVENVDQVRQIERIESVERLKAVVSHEVNVLKAAGAGSLAVMLRPDADTELFVQLTRSGDKIDAFVRLEKGNSAELRQNWDQLQASLGNQQIRLLPLQSSDFHQQSQRQTAQHDGHDFQDPARNGASRDSAGFGRQSRGEQGNGGEGQSRRQAALIGVSTDALPVSPRLAVSGRGHRQLETWA